MWVVQDKPWTQRCKSGVYMDWIGISWKVHCMNPVVWKMPPQPFYATQICRKSMLYDKVLTKPKNIRGVKKRFLLGCDKMFLLGPFKTLLHPNPLGQIIGMVISVSQSRLWRCLMFEIWVLFPVFLHKRPVA